MFKVNENKLHLYLLLKKLKFQFSKQTENIISVIINCTQNNTILSCFNNFKAAFLLEPGILLEWTVQSLAKRWQFYLSSDGETYAVCGGAGNPQAHHRCHYYYCCCCCYCSPLSCHSMLALHPADSLVPVDSP